MDPHVQEWLSLAVRWFHIVVGIAWIGASFYFNWLENQIDRTGNHLRKGIAGDLWAIHGGGFYFLEKYKVAPDKLPEKLHWFKYEAYLTWISGVILLIITYYLNLESNIIDSRVRELSSLEAIGIGVGVIAGGWLIYDLLCKSPLAKRPLVFGIFGFSLFVGLSYFLANVFGPKAAYIHVGAVLGTLMAGNVFFVIIPSQKSLVEAATKGEELNPQLGINAGLRSRHNNYLTLPVLFIMISSHYPSTYGNAANWQILVGISIVGALIRHYFNVRHLPKFKVWMMPTAFLLFIGLAMFARPKGPLESSGSDGEASQLPIPSTIEVAAIIAERCQTCHSQTPTDNEWATAPNGVMFDEIPAILDQAESIKLRVVDTHIMPLGNKTNMTIEERLIIGRWLESQK